MVSPVRSHYRVTGYVGTDDMTAYVTIDKKNNSIYLSIRNGLLLGSRNKNGYNHPAGRQARDRFDIRLPGANTKQ